MGTIIVHRAAWLTRPPDTTALVADRYFGLFRRLRDHAATSDNAIYAVQSLLLAGIYHAVDNVPHPIAQSLFAEAAIRCLDAGLYREITPMRAGDFNEREIRRVSGLLLVALLTYFCSCPFTHTSQRTAWACFVWDKQLAAFCGRPPLLFLFVTPKNMQRR